MTKKLSTEIIRFPDARLTGIDAFFDLVKNEPNWRPDPINRDTLSTLAIAKGKETNLLFALRFLGVVDEAGSPTKEFDSLRMDFQPTLKRLVLTAYAKVFQTIPVSRADQTTLVRFFCNYGYSEDTAEYQAKLFVKLCSLAEIELPIVEKTFKRARFQKPQRE